MKKSLKFARSIRLLGILTGLAVSANSQAGVKTYLDWLGNSIVEIADAKGVGSYYIIDGSSGAIEKKGYFAADKQSDCPTKISINIGALADHSGHFHQVIYSTCSQTLAINKFNAKGNFTSVATDAEQVGLMSSGDDGDQVCYTSFEPEPLIVDDAEPGILLEYGNDESTFTLDRGSISLPQ